MSGTGAVIVRRIPDPERLQIDRRTGQLLTEGVPFILNPVDRSALELALRLKDEHDWRVVVLTVDEPEADFELREGLAMGADEGLLLSDSAFAGNDPTMQANLFKVALERFVQPDVVFAASRSVDHTWSTVGPELAALLDWPLIIEAEDIELVDGSLHAHAHSGGAFRARTRAPLPCLVTVARGVVGARHATSWGVAQAIEEKTVDTKGLADLGLKPDQLKDLAPRTEVVSLELEKPERKGTTWEGSPDQVGRILARRLDDMGYTGRRR